MLNSLGNTKGLKCKTRKFLRICHEYKNTYLFKEWASINRWKYSFFLYPKCNWPREFLFLLSITKPLKHLACLLSLFFQWYWMQISWEINPIEVVLFLGSVVPLYTVMFVSRRWLENICRCCVDETAHCLIPPCVLFV